MTWLPFRPLTDEGKLQKSLQFIADGNHSDYLSVERSFEFAHLQSGLNALFQCRESFWKR